MRFLFSLLTTVSVVSILSAQQVNIAPTLAWVKPVTFNTNIISTDTINSSGGYYDLLADDQHHLAIQQTYYHYAQVITAIAESFGLAGFDQETTRTIIRGVIGTAIWVPYFLVSERAKGTFTVRR